MSRNYTTPAPLPPSQGGCYSLYQDNPLLKGIRTKYDLDMNNVYGKFAQSYPYGPNPTPNAPVSARHMGVGFAPLATAYEWSGGAYMDYSKKPANYN